MVGMQYRCVGFERLAFSGCDLFINDDKDSDSFFTLDSIIFYKKDNSFHFVTLGSSVIKYNDMLANYVMKDLTENNPVYLKNLFAYNFHNKEDCYLSNNCVKIKPFYIVYDDVHYFYKNFLICNCKKFCIGLERNQSLIFNSKKDAQTFIKDNQLKNNIIKVDRLFQMKFGDAI